MRLNTLLPLACVISLAACVSLPSPTERRSQAAALAQASNWQGLELRAGAFRLQAYVPSQTTVNEVLTLYLEGDGLAWLNSHQPSLDPTPLDPLALRLALAQPNGNAAYLGRPCQYLGATQEPCQQGYWTEQRFAEVVVASLDQASDTLKARFGARRLTLVGYSGGGALALLLAARRNDVEQVITVAGNLDHAAWTRLHRVTPLQGSLNPAELRASLAQVPQVHLQGQVDQVTPATLARDFVAGYPPMHHARVKVIPGFDHHCCWAQEWPNLWRGMHH
ncbi:alpha/beta hydrolase [Aquipseudomonas alcaligenes]|uniref:Alpha/beta hydrolase n=1 Tax=Aquipseudomonas alcaligenes TaxID=43263 RepID=A0A1N6XIC3_AQUAC|nr:alpha/beta hydrolase [Pseudomonas alcaligenes]SIR02040.1 hypothetical protein SAMN05878282_1132 [Pseudomonas alcaligenes]